jgi:hypothetical protein
MIVRHNIKFVRWRNRPIEALAQQVSVRLKDRDADIHGLLSRTVPGSVVKRRLLGGRWYTVEIPADLEISRAIELLEGAGEVESAEPVEVYTTQVGDTIPPDDPDYSQQWALDLINAEAGWDVTTGSERVLLGVIDTGIALANGQVSHPDLDAGRFILGNDYVEDDAAPQLPPDAPPATPAATEPQKGSPSHGNQVVGVIAARANNTTGIAGLNWVSSIYIAKVFGWYHRTWNDEATGQAKSQWRIALGADDLAAAIEDAVDLAATRRQRLVLNFSGSAPRGGGLVEDAVKYLGEHDGLLCASSGNDAQNNATPPVPAGVGFPARLASQYAWVLAVGAVDRNDVVANFSNSGAELTVVAPGVSVRTLTRNGYTNSNGTSFAAPYTAGLASLILSWNPNLSAGEVREIITQTAIKLAPNQSFNQLWGHGRIDVAAALAATPKLDNAGGTMSNFVIVVNGEKVVKKTQAQTLTFNLPQDLDVASPVVLQYMLRHNGVANLDLRVTLNSYWEQRNNLQGTEWKTFHHVINAGPAKKGQNTATFEIQDGTGDIVVSDVVVLFRQK